MVSIPTRYTAPQLSAPHYMAPIQEFNHHQGIVVNLHRMTPFISVAVHRRGCTLIHLCNVHCVYSTGNQHMIHTVSNIPIGLQRPTALQRRRQCVSGNDMISPRSKPCTLQAEIATFKFYHRTRIDKFGGWNNLRGRLAEYFLSGTHNPRIIGLTTPIVGHEITLTSKRSMRTSDTRYTVTVPSAR